MRCFVDSADDKAVSALLAEKLVHGVTTNPQILRAAGIKYERLEGLVTGRAELGAEVIDLQTWGKDRAALLSNAAQLKALAPVAGIKVPATEVGFGVAATLAAAGVSVLVTAVYEAAQALYARSIGARCIAPYLGRMDDAGRDGAKEIAVIVDLLAGSDTEVLAASVRSPQRMIDLALLGVTSAPASPEVLRAALVSADPDGAAAAFEAAMADLR